MKLTILWKYVVIKKSKVEQHGVLFTRFLIVFADCELFKRGDSIKFWHYVFWGDTTIK